MIKSIIVEYHTSRTDKIELTNPIGKSNAWLKLKWQLLDGIRKDILEAMGDLVEIGLK